MVSKTVAGPWLSHSLGRQFLGELTVAGPWLSHSLGRQSIIGFKRPTVAGPWLSHSLGRQSMIGQESRKATRIWV